ncbi:NAD-dependent epimerase/dehydratase family protein [Fibrisoma montanum]|uniref:NAD-dependent epimerase/dehydratase family protein n=1 Tax=Fibrisoma montanum TaxID=2305895 RepID=A0A418M858_9BACT|nr:NAD-dependent epimerase/dehydratase family protein [Fibrisoma montanum]RIV22293.1 NAD-dependent epimerase/dehydratase family protein [Fibrisoma montanum]
MKVLVTGATGFVGRHVIPHLLSEGCEVVATSTNVEAAARFPWFKQIRFIPYRIKPEGDSQDLFAFFDKPDAMLHLAWYGLPNYKASFHFDQNLFPQYYFLKNLIQHGLHNLTVTGTCFEYGMQSGCLQEEGLTQPGNPYGLAKESLHRFLQALKAEQSFTLKWARLFYMYGDGQNSNSLLPLLDKAIREKALVFNMSGGEQLRDYLPIDKVAHYLCRIALQNTVEGPINCCSGQPISVRRLVENYLQEANASIHLNLGHYPYPDYEPMAFWGDNRKLIHLLTSTSHE